MLDNTIKAYLYQQYAQDDNLQAFFTAYNSLSEKIYQWMKSANLPIFIGSYNYGDQLKWIAKGIYGQDPPIIVTSKSVTYGPYNMLMFNQLAINSRKNVTSSNQITTSDDVFKRIMTWNFYKGDGFYFTVPWLKRRISRFLNGVNGQDVINDEQWNISVKFPSDGSMLITLYRVYTQIYNSSEYGVMGFDAQPFGYVETRSSLPADIQFAEVFKQAFDSGLLHMPFWSKVTVNITG